MEYAYTAPTIVWIKTADTNTPTATQPITLALTSCASNITSRRINSSLSRSRVGRFSLFGIECLLRIRIVERQQRPLCKLIREERQPHAADSDRERKSVVEGKSGDL